METNRSDADLPVGGAVFRGSPDYEQRRRGLSWTRTVPERHPNAIVPARDVADVQNAVRFAVDKGWLIAPKSGGHSHIGSSIRDDALVIDMAAMNHLEIDPVARKAKVGPGVKSDQLAEALAQHGLAFPVGHCRSTGMGGYLLGGGLGINWNQWGPACYSVTGLDVVGADGSVRKVDDENDGDLMWLARGCGPSFPGVITAYYLDVKPMPAIRVSMYVFPLEDTSVVSAWLDELTPRLSATVEPFAFLAGPVFGGDAPPEARFIAVAAFAFDEDEEAAEVALRPLRSTPRKPLMAEHASPRQFQDLFALIDLFLPPDKPRVHCDSMWSDDGVQQLLGALEQHMASCPSPLNNILLFQPPRIPLRDNACFSMMRSNIVTIYGLHESEEENEANADWVAEGMALLEPFTAGYWVNEADLLADPGRASNSFAPEVWSRMRSVRSKYDDWGLFADFPSLQGS
ncbi:FAD-binding oxidoreductase [Streptomyces sp. NPDC005799]|uniref:FAD-binding oxidoreductase n=1 Tax=Streptomyces sp. NPDC005799 TaxID=3154678 RepID=UPI0033F6B625